MKCSDPVPLWSDRSPDELPAEALERRAAQLVQRALPLPEISEARLARLRPWAGHPRRLEGSLRDLWRLSLLALGVLVTVNLAIAAGLLTWDLLRDRWTDSPAWLLSPPIEIPQVPTGQWILRRAHAARPPARAPRVAGPALGLRSAPTPSALAPPAPVVTVSTPLAEETAELDEALHQLHVENDPTGALATLVVYRHRFPKGLLGPEATQAELEAHLQAGQRAEALALLNGLAAHGFQGVARAGEFQLLRAELLSEMGNCPEALRGFQEAFDHAEVPSLRERALYGRGSCRARSGDPNGSRADFHLYLGIFPRGRFADIVRKVLGQNASSNGTEGRRGPAEFP